MSLKAKAIQSTRPTPAQLRALVELMLSTESARQKVVPLNHLPESLARSPAKLEVIVNALLVFIDKGIPDATVQDLLDAAQISRRTFYKYFRNKIDVLENLYKLAVDVMVLRYQSDVVRADNVQDLAHHFVDDFFIYHNELALVIRMMQEEAMRLDSPLAPHRAEAMLRVGTLLNDQLQRITGKKIDPLLIRSVMGAMEAVSIEYLREGIVDSARIEHGRETMRFLANSVFQSAVAN